MAPAGNVNLPITRFVGLINACLLFVSIIVTAEKQTCDVCNCSSVRTGTKVDCRNKGLTELPSAIPINTSVLLLGDNAIKEVPYDGLMHLRKLKNLYISNNMIATPFELPESVGTIVAGNNTLQSMRPLLKNGIYIKELNFSRNKLKVIETDTFSRCKYLHSLVLLDNEIEEIPAGLFSHSAKRHLELLDNGTREVTTGLFLDRVEKHLRHQYLFRLLNLQNNRIRRIAPGAFDGVGQLLSLILAMNELRSLPEDMLANTTIIHLLDISSNRLTSIPDTLLRKQFRLNMLILCRNNIRVLNSEMFKGLHSLKELMIFGNPIVQLADGMLRETNVLRLFMFQTNLTSKGIGSRPFATMKKTIENLLLYGSSELDAISSEMLQDLATGCYVAVSNVLKFAPVTNRTDLTIELVDDGFVQPQNVSTEVASILKRSGFRVEKIGINDEWRCTPCSQGTYGAQWFINCKDCPPGGFYQMKTGQVAVKEEDMNCQLCNEGTYVTVASHPGTNPKDCTVCPTGSLLWTGTKALYNLGFFRCLRLRGFVMSARYRCGTQRNATGYQSSDQDPPMTTDEEDSLRVDVTDDEHDYNPTEDSLLIDVTCDDHHDYVTENDHHDDTKEDAHLNDVTEDDSDDVTENDNLIDLT